MLTATITSNHRPAAMSQCGQLVARCGDAIAERRPHQSTPRLFHASVTALVFGRKRLKADRRLPQVNDPSWISDSFTLKTTALALLVLPLLVPARHPPIGRASLTAPQEHPVATTQPLTSL